MRHLITLAWLAAAVAAYLAGSVWGASVLVVVGILLEGVFWMRLRRGRGYDRSG